VRRDPIQPLEAHLDQRIELVGPDHVALGASQVRGRVTGASAADRGALAPGELDDEHALLLGRRQEDWSDGGGGSGGGGKQVSPSTTVVREVCPTYRSRAGS